MSYTSLGSKKTKGLLEPHSPSFFRQLTGLSSGPLKGAFGLTSKGTAFIQGVLALVPPGAEEHKILQFKQDLEASWKNRTLRYRGEAMSSFLQEPQIRTLVLNELHKILTGQPNAKLITGEQDGPILDMMAGVYFIDSVVLPDLSPYFPPNELKVLREECLAIWPQREYPQRDAVKVYTNKCFQIVIHRFSASMRKQLDDFKKGGYYTPEHIKGKLMAIVPIIVNGVDNTLNENFYTNAEGEIIGTKIEREHIMVGKVCDVPFMPTYTKATPESSGFFKLDDSPRSKPAGSAEGEMTVVLRSTGPNFSETHRVMPTDTVFSLKQKLENGKMGFPADKTRFEFRGKEMVNGKTLADYGVQDGSAIEVIFTFGGRKTRRKHRKGKNTKSRKFHR
jgi:hypothetical protein